MLSSVLRSEQAVQVNIAIMRAFVAMRGLRPSDSDLAHKTLVMEKKYDKQFEIVFRVIQQLIEAPPPVAASVSGPTQKRRTHEIRLLQRVR